MARPAHQYEGLSRGESPRLHPRLQRLDGNPVPFDFPAAFGTNAAPAAPRSSSGRADDVIGFHATAVRVAVSTVRAHVQSVARKATAAHRADA